VQPTWSGPPTLEEIRAQDDMRLLADPLLAEEAAEDDKGTIEALTAKLSASELAAALVRLHRARLPAIEDVTDPGFRPDPQPSRAPNRHEQPARQKGQGTWFRLNVGRSDRADPRHLLPMLCRRGDIGRQDIGAIRIFDRETKVEIDPARADHFAQSVRRTAGAGAILIEPSEPPFKTRPEPAARPSRPERAPDGKPHRRGKAPARAS
jgi:ATP-dependent RNA helicase DeaD